MPNKITTGERPHSVRKSTGDILKQKMKLFLYLFLINHYMDIKKQDVSASDRSLLPHGYVLWFTAWYAPNILKSSAWHQCCRGDWMCRLWGLEQDLQGEVCELMWPEYSFPPPGKRAEGRCSLLKLLCITDTADISRRDRKGRIFIVTGVTSLDVAKRWEMGFENDGLRFKCMMVVSVFVF